MKSILFAILFFISVISLAEMNTDKAIISLSHAQIESYGITTAPLKIATEVLSVRFPAKVVVPNSQLQMIAALQDGLVKSLMATEGDNVKQGQLLARIQSPGLLELQRDLLQTLTQLNLAKSTLDRDQQLLNEGIIPKRRYLESRSTWQELVTQKEQQEATLQFSGMTKAAIIELEKNRKLSSILTVIAPFDGVLLEQMAIAGQKLDAADPLFQIGKLSPLWLEIHVPVEVVRRIIIGDTIFVEEMNIEGEIITIGHKVHAADQGTLIRAIVRDNIDQLRPGQFVQIRFVLNTNEQQHYFLPREAIVRLNQKTIIFIETKQGFQAINVDVTGNRDGQQIITSDQIISAPVVTSGGVALKAILTGAGGEG